MAPAITDGDLVQGNAKLQHQTQQNANCLSPHRVLRGLLPVSYPSSANEISASFRFAPAPPPLVQVPVLAPVIVVLVLKLAALTSMLDTLLGDKDGLLEGGRDDIGEVHSEPFSGLLFPVAAHGMPDFRCNDSAVKVVTLPETGGT